MVMVALVLACIGTVAVIEQQRRAMRQLQEVLKEGAQARSPNR